MNRTILLLIVGALTLPNSILGFQVYRELRKSAAPQSEPARDPGIRKNSGPRTSLTDLATGVR